MASITIRNLDDQVKERLGVRAALHGVSMEEEARRILRKALDQGAADTGLGSRTAAILFGKIQAERQLAGRPLTTEDAQIASIALMHKMALATRNTGAFQLL